MKRTLLLILLFVIINTNFISADRLVISDGEINETIIRNDFAYHYLDNLFINQEKLSLFMDKLAEQVYEPPTNASLDESWSIIPEKNGYALDRENFIRFFYEFYYSNVSFEMKVPKKKLYPKVDSELLSDIRTNEIGSYLTYYRAGNKERSHNIRLATEAINNYVVFPGEEFSFNKVVGKRTVDKGYKRAPVIVKGELSEDVGGGICQVSSTLFNAVSLKGIKIVERYSHSRSVPYVPPGRDATVSWWGPDFVFKNEYSHPILIRAKANDGKMSIRIYSSDSVEYNQ
ncbi:VanW family protein [Ornithinibacillus californiensis]|uniref:VanW family protein n=1 Tax=Ornithinibacillus californiensis TaxID=161536 RepID=UPI00064DC1CB|nr:VanW family protein [Ornithinibacillus californiensis]